jgi:orotidine-5'-phosphate decarboxylase
VEELSMNFTERLVEIQSERRSLLCIGLDTDPRRLPPHLGTGHSAVLEFNRRIIESTRDLVCAYKLNLAFYEALGSEGWSVLRKTRTLIPHNILAIADGKRGDIGNTAERYAFSLFDDLGFDAITVNPLMGFDSVEPFLTHSSKGVFILTLTSNPGSKDFQQLRVGRRALYEKIAASAAKWNSVGSIGLVVGATRPRELKKIRSIAPGMPILIPGVGTQGGDLKAAIRYGCDKKGFLALINASRSVLYASLDSDFASVARGEATSLRNQIESHRSTYYNS